MRFGLNHFQEYLLQQAAYLVVSNYEYLLKSSEHHKLELHRRKRQRCPFLKYCSYQCKTLCILQTLKLVKKAAPTLTTVLKPILLNWDSDHGRHETY